MIAARSGEADNELRKELLDALEQAGLHRCWPGGLLQIFGLSACFSIVASHNADLGG